MTRQTRIAALAALLLTALACNLPGLLGGRADGQLGLRLGDPVDVLTTAIPPAGGWIQVDRPGSPLDGLAIEVPAGAYAGSIQFAIRYRPIESHSYGERLQPLTPLIEIDNGGVEAETHLILHLPAEVPPESFVMAFRYDRESGELEGLPVLSIKGGEVQVPVRHFSDLLLTWVKEELLTQPITTGFVQGRDNWPFPNDGSYAQQAGHCAGQTLSALYYFQRLRGEPLFTAFDGYDNGFRRTPDLPEDDRMGQRLSTAAQAINRVEGSSTRVQYWLERQIDEPRLSMLTFALTMWLTGEPQLVQLQRDGPEAHAVLAYAAKGNVLFISDPNHPDEQRTLTYLPAERRFAEYTTGLTSRGLPTTFKYVYFIPAREAIDWAALGSLWEQFLAGTVGESLFPSYTLWAQDAAPDAADVRRPLADGFKTWAKQLRVTFEPEGFEGRAVLYNEAAKAYDAILTGGSTEIELQTGTTTVGFLIEGVDKGGVHHWVDFRWVDILQGDPPTPTVPPTAAVAPSGNFSIEECNALPYLRIAPTEAQSLAITDGTTCNLRLELEDMHPDSPIITFQYRTAQYNHGETRIDTWETKSLDPGAQAFLALHRTLHEGIVQDANDFTLIGAVLADWDHGPGCRWIWQDPGASGFPFQSIENPCR